MTEMVEKIHRDFKSSLDASSITGFPEYSEKTDNLVNRLESVGFGNSKTAQKLAHTQKLASQGEAAKFLQEVQTMYPKYRLIGLKAVLELCEKYDLVLGTQMDYVAHVPVENLEEIEEHKKITMRGGFARLNSCLDILEKTDPYTASMPCSYFVVAPRSYFDASKVITSRMVTDLSKPKLDLKIQFNKPTPAAPDPIVLCPLKPTQLGVVFQIVTAWGPEADDDMVSSKITSTSSMS